MLRSPASTASRRISERCRSSSTTWSDPTGLPSHTTKKFSTSQTPGGAKSGVPDGMKVDTQGNVYSGGAGGLYIIDPRGRKLGRIVHGHPATANIAFGGDDWKTLYFPTRSTLFSVHGKIPGVPVPAKKRTG